MGSQRSDSGTERSGAEGQRSHSARERRHSDLKRNDMDGEPCDAYGGGSLKNVAGSIMPAGGRGPACRSYLCLFARLVSVARPRKAGPSAQFI